MSKFSISRLTEAGKRTIFNNGVFDAYYEVIIYRNMFYQYNTRSTAIIPLQAASTRIRTLRSYTSLVQTIEDRSKRSKRIMKPFSLLSRINSRDSDIQRESMYYPISIGTRIYMNMR